MNKFYGEGKDGAVLALVLEPGNIHKLMEERKPIEVKLHEGPWKGGLPPKITLTVFYSETPIADAREIAKTMNVGEFGDTRTPVMKTKRPHCPNCKSTIEQLGVMKSDQPVWLVFCPMCGNTLGAIPPQQGLKGV